MPESIVLHRGLPCGCLVPVSMREAMPFQLGGLSHHGATGHLGVPCPDSGRALENKPQLPWHDRRRHISLPSECQLRQVKRRSQLMMALQFKSIEISR